jgi:hypothetical protein
MAPSQRFNVSTLVPSSRDFLQAVRTGKKGLVLVPCLAAEDSAREALRLAESDVAALAMNETSQAMAAAAHATRLPMLSLVLVASREDALEARAFGADAVILDPAASDTDREAAATSARSTRMVALPLARSASDVEREVARGAKAIVVQAPDAKTLGELAIAAGRLLVIAWPSRPIEGDLELLRGQVDAAVVGVDVYGVTGFERLVSELNP